MFVQKHTECLLFLFVGCANQNWQFAKTIYWCFSSRGGRFGKESVQTHTRRQSLR